MVHMHFLGQSARKSRLQVCISWGSTSWLHGKSQASKIGSHIVFLQAGWVPSRLAALSLKWLQDVFKDFNSGCAVQQFQSPGCKRDFQNIALPQRTIWDQERLGQCERGVRGVEGQKMFKKNITWFLFSSGYHLSLLFLTVAPRARHETLEAPVSACLPWGSTVLGNCLSWVS